jgi:hypothetical protein
MESDHNAKPGLEQPKTGPASAKKFACKDCDFCQFCSDSRCRCCRSAKTGKSCSKISIAEQIRLFDELNANDPFLRKRKK